MREERSEQSGENIPLLSLLYFVFLGQRMQTSLPVSVSHLSLPEISMNELALKLIESLPYVPPILLWSPL